MQMKRRSFIGSVIGTLAINQIPFVAKAHANPLPHNSMPQMLEDPDVRYTMFQVPFHTLLNFKMALDIEINSERQWIEGGILSAERDGSTICLRHEDVIAKQDTLYRGLAVWSPDGKLVCRKGFREGAQVAKANGTLRAKYILSRPIQVHEVAWHGHNPDVLHPPGLPG